MNEIKYSEDIQKFYNLYKYNKNFSISVIGDFGLTILQKSNNSEFLIRFEEIKEVEFLPSGSVKFSMKNKSFLKLDGFDGRVVVGL